MPRKSRFTLADFEDWRRLYVLGHSTKQIAALYQVDGGTIYDRLKQMGITFRSPSESKRLFTLNEAAFAGVETEETAYWLGFLYADGCVLAKRHAVQLALKEEDRVHVEAFRAFLSADYPISIDHRRKAVRITISSASLYANLVALGCTPRKSMALTMPPLPGHLLHHFVRGYFDGDGSAYFGGGAPTMSFVGNKSFLEQIKSTIDQATNAGGRLYPHAQRQAWYLVYRGQFKVPVVRGWLYQDATIWLARKRIRLEGYPPGKRIGYPSAAGYRAVTAGNVSQETIQRYIDAQSGK